MAHRGLVALAALVALSGCGSPEPSISGQVRVLASWSGAEQEAFEAVLAPFEARTGVDVEYASTRDLRGELAEELAAGSPPDVAGLDGPAHMRELAAAGSLRDLGGVLDMGSYRSSVAPTFIDIGTVDGRLVGLFLRSSVKGLIWYSPRVFRLAAPRTWDELGRAALQAGSRADATWCLGLASEEASGWPGTDLVEQFLVRGSGPGTYDRWAAGELPWTAPEVRRAFELYGQVAAEDSVLGGVEAAIETDFRAAWTGLFSDPTGCLFLPQGSFMPAFFAEQGLEPVADYDFFPFPAVEANDHDVVVGAGDLFGLLTDEPAAAELIRYLVSDEAQTRWVSRGGALSVRASVIDYPDPISRRAATLLTSADTFRFDASDQMPGPMSAAFRQAVIDVAADPRSLDDVLASLEVVRRSADPTG